MSGAKRKSQYRKGVTTQYLQGKTAGQAVELSDADINEGDVIARVKSNNGGNIFSAELEDGLLVQAKLPSKFHKVIWVRPGDLVVLHGMADGEEVSVHNIKNILSKDMVKALSKQNALPESFRSAAGVEKGGGYDMDSIMPAQDAEDEDGEQEEEDGVEDKMGNTYGTGVDVGVI